MPEPDWSGIARGGFGAAFWCVILSSPLNPTCILTHRMGLVQLTQHLAVSLLLAPTLVLTVGWLRRREFASPTSRRSFFVVAAAFTLLGFTGFAFGLVQRVTAF